MLLDLAFWWDSQPQPPVADSFIYRLLADRYRGQLEQAREHDDEEELVGALAAATWTWEVRS